MIFIIIPAYNEENKIVEVIKNIKEKGYNNIIVVDDGSQDKTFELAEKQGIYVLSHIINRGQGAALKTGIDFALLKGASILVTFDSDGQHDPNDIIKLVNVVKNRGFDVAIGSRFLKTKSNVPFIRKMFLKGGAFLMWLLYGIRLTDSHNGIRALSCKAAKKIEIKSDRMEHASEIIEQIAYKKLKYIEVPVTIKYTNYSLKHGQSNLAAFKILAKMMFRKLTK